MKAVICEFCGKVIPSSDRVSMVYGIHIYGADEFEAQSRAEKECLLDVEHICQDCTRKVKAAIGFIRKGTKK